RFGYPRSSGANANVAVADKPTPARQRRGRGAKALEFPDQSETSGGNRIAHDRGLSGEATPRDPI
ncbi:MAG TPA: hypothetical protein DHW63_03455, partial [Hyphomonadaceae bacterium]|nr:hypothetical protein [Hyphomonadaceae bacterium]